MKKISRVVALLFISLFVVAVAINTNTQSAYAYGELKITQVGETKDYGGGSYGIINMRSASIYNTIHTNPGVIGFSVLDDYYTGMILKVNGNVIYNPRCVGFANHGGRCFVNLVVPNLNRNMNNYVEVICGGSGNVPQVSDSIYINVQ